MQYNRLISSNLTDRRYLDVRTLTSQFINKLSTGFAEIIHISLQLLQHLLQVTDCIIILPTTTATSYMLHISITYAHQYTIRSIGSLLILYILLSKIIKQTRLAPTNISYSEKIFRKTCNGLLFSSSAKTIGVSKMWY